MTEAPVTFSSEGFQLVGMLHSIAHAADRAVILCHGLGGNKVEGNRIFVETGRALTAVGYDVLRFDFYGSGDSEGEFADTTVAHNVENCKSAIHFMRDAGYKKLGLLGLSLGAAAAIITASHEQVEALITFSAVVDVHALFESKAPASLARNPEVSQYEHEGWLVKRSFWENALSYDVLSAFKTLAIPKLILQGDADEPDFVKGFAQLQRNAIPPCDCYLFPGVGHTCKTVSERKQFIRIVRRWLRQKLL